MVFVLVMMFALIGVLGDRLWVGVFGFRVVDFGLIVILLWL